MQVVQNRDEAKEELEIDNFSDMEDYNGLA